MPDLVGLTIVDEPAAWAQIGFAVSRAAFVVGGVMVGSSVATKVVGQGGRSSTRTRSGMRGGMSGDAEVGGSVRSGGPVGPGGGCGAV